MSTSVCLSLFPSICLSLSVCTSICLCVCLSSSVCLSVHLLILIIQTYRPWTPRRMSGIFVNIKIWREREAYRNFSKWFDWSMAIKSHIVMAAPIVETIWLVNGFKRHIVMAAPFAVTAPSSVQNLINSSSRWFDGKSRSLDDRDYPSVCPSVHLSVCLFVCLPFTHLCQRKISGVENCGPSPCMDTNLEEKYKTGHGAVSNEIFKDKT